MSASPTIRSSQPPVAARDVVTLNGAVERLFEAADAAAVMDICELILDQLGICGRLHWRRPDDIGDGPGEKWLDLAEDPQVPHTLSLAWDEAPLTPAARESLQWLGRLADIRLRQLAETSRLYEAISRLALAERLQRALYAIADQASAEHDMPQMMRSLHAIVSSLMYAENFYIVLYDPATDQVRFTYCVDIVDTDLPVLNQPMPLQDMEYSLTWSLLRGGRPMMGSLDDLVLQLGERFRLFGARCEDWLGVPMLRDGQVAGGIVVQSYRPDTHYSRHDMELLNYVAQHVQTALERREAHLELGRRVTDRTAALREANRVLRQHDMTWTGFVVLWVVWIWDGMETRHVAESADISKATLTGVVKTLEGRGLIVREGDERDRRLVRLRLTDEGTSLMEQIYPEFNAVESEIVSQLSDRKVSTFTRTLREVVKAVEVQAEARDEALDEA